MKLTINDLILKKEIKNSNIPILVEYWSNWCMTCKVLNNILKEIKILYKYKLKIIKINIDLNYYSTEKFSIKSVPTILIIKNKKLVLRKYGFISREYIKNYIKKLIKFNDKRNF